MTVTVTIRQNASSTPGVSARLTRVELSENARTTPTTASAPERPGTQCADRQVGLIAVIGSGA